MKRGEKVIKFNVNGIEKNGKENNKNIRSKEYGKKIEKMREV